jgi:hypothetical protein
VKSILTVLTFLLIQCLTEAAFAQKYHHEDSLTREQSKKLKRDEFRKNTQRYFFEFAAVNARLDTKVEFDILDELLTAKVGLEDNLGLPGKRAFLTAVFIHRFTPASGIYVNYYGINRTEDHETEQDIIFHSDTIPAGTKSKVFFNTQVVSMGYLLSLKRDPNAFLGAYFNLYLMWLQTGASSDLGSIDTKVNFAAPLPNFGLVAMFRLNSWMHMEGNVGFFSLKMDDFDGTLFDFNITLNFKPLHWLGLSVSYQEFDIRVGFPYESIYTTVDYNFRGPAVGLNFTF